MKARRAAVLKSIDEQGKLTPELRAAIDAAPTKQELEDLYLPYKPRRRTKAQMAREAGLEPLADALFDDPTLSPEAEAAKYVNTASEPPEQHVPDVKAALDGARQILMERFSEDAALLEKLRAYLNDNALIVAAVVEGKEAEGAKFRDWFDFAEPIATMPSHRALALLRGRNEGMLQVALVLDSELDPEAVKPGTQNPCEQRIAVRFGIKPQNRSADARPRRRGPPPARRRHEPPAGSPAARIEPRHLAVSVRRPRC